MIPFKVRTAAELMQPQGFDQIDPSNYTPDYNAQRAGYRFVDTGDGAGYWVNQDGERAQITGEDGSQNTLIPNAMWGDLNAQGYAQDTGDLAQRAKLAQYGAQQGFGGNQQAYLDYVYGPGSSVVNDPRFGSLIKAGDPSKAGSPTPVALPNTSNGWFKDFAIPAALTAAMVYGGGVAASSAMGAGEAAGASGWTSGYDLAGGGSFNGAPMSFAADAGSGASGLDVSVNPISDSAGWTSGYDVPSMESAAGGSPMSFTAGPGQSPGAVYGAMTGGGSTSLADLAKYGMLANGVSSIIGAGAAKSAANTAADASNRATDAQLGMFNTLNNQSAPYRQAGYTALNDISGMKGYFNHQFDANDLKTNLAPNYQFQLDQGLGAVKNAENLKTGFSGNFIKGVNDYAQNYAGGAYQQAFNNYTTNQNNIFNRLSSIAGLGQTSNANNANVGANISGNAAQTIVGSGQAQAAGTIGAANAIGSGANNALSWYTLPQILGNRNG